MSTDLLRVDRGEQADKLGNVANTNWMRANRRHLDGWRIKGAWQWFVAMASFALFLVLEGLLLYAYYIYLAAR